YGRIGMGVGACIHESTFEVVSSVHRPPHRLICSSQPHPELCVARVQHDGAAEVSGGLPVLLAGEMDLADASANLPRGVVTVARSQLRVSEALQCTRIGAQRRLQA